MGLTLPIPNTVHFVYGMSLSGRDRPFGLADAIAIESARMAHNPQRVVLHCGTRPQGPWWEILRRCVHLREVTPPTSVFGRPVDRVEHRADLVRLEALLEFGGIYLDLDTISVKSLAPLRRHRCVLGIEETPGQANHGLSNAVMMAEPGSAFLTRWKENYRTFNQDYWSTHSVVLPRLLAQEAAPDELHVEPVESFHWPSWNPEGIADMFQRDVAFPKAYVHHLWASTTYGPFLRDLTPAQIRAGTSTYCRLARPVLERLV